MNMVNEEDQSARQSKQPTDSSPNFVKPSPSQLSTIGKKDADQVSGSSRQIETNALDSGRATSKLRRKTQDQNLIEGK